MTPGNRKQQMDFIVSNLLVFRFRICEDEFNEGKENSKVKYSPKYQYHLNNGFQKVNALRASTETFSAQPLQNF